MSRSARPRTRKEIFCGSSRWAKRRPRRNCRRRGRLEWYRHDSWTTRPLPIQIRDISVNIISKGIIAKLVILHTQYPILPKILLTIGDDVIPPNDICIHARCREDESLGVNGGMTASCQFAVPGTYFGGGVDDIRSSVSSSSS